MEFKNKKQINENSTLAEVLENEGAESILKKYSVPCLSCPMMSFEMNKLTLKQISEMYGVNLKALIGELNKKIDS